MSHCKSYDCKENQVILSDNCWEHTRDKAGYINSLAAYIKDGGDLRGANLQKVSFRGLELHKCNFSGANLHRCDFRDASLFDSIFSDAELLGSNFGNADLTGANFERADLTRADLTSARLWHANLEGANLSEAVLSCADFFDAKLYDIRLWRTNLQGALSINRRSFEHKTGRLSAAYKLNEKGHSSAEDAYRILKNLFSSNGQYDDASWAAFKEKEMEKSGLRNKRNVLYIPAAVMGLLCGYGEKPARIIISSIFIICFYASLYYFLNAVRFSLNESYCMSALDYLYYSTITFTTVGYGDFIPRAAPQFKMIAASEAFTGVFIMGLFVFTLSRKYSAR